MGKASNSKTGQCQQSSKKSDRCSVLFFLKFWPGTCVQGKRKEGDQMKLKGFVNHAYDWLFILRKAGLHGES
jgi:hypothetical protein